MLCIVIARKTIRRVDTKDGAFWGCAHWPLCQGKVNACRTCGNGIVVSTETSDGARIFRCTVCQTGEPACPRCNQGHLVIYTGQYGPFHRCSTWDGGEGCQFKRDVAIAREALP